jgi:hypothetical protein
MTVSFGAELPGGGRATIEISNDGFDHEQAISLIINEKTINEDGSVTERELATAELFATELHQALAPFLQKYWENKELERD